MVYKMNKKDACTFFSKPWRMQNFYKIRTKARTIIPFAFNPVQLDMSRRHEACGFRGIREIYSKSRQHGVTTYWEIAYLDDTLITPNTVTSIVAHRQKDVQKLFRIVKFAYKACPDQFLLESGQVWEKPRASYDNMNELVFPEINSAISVGLDVRSGTVNNLHVSEAAFIKDAADKIVAASMEAVPKRELGSNISVESTSNGVGNWYEEEWNMAEDGDGEFDAFFYGWFADPQNAIAPPKGWKPADEEAKIRKLVWDRYKVKLTDAQLFWHETKRKRLRRLMPQENPSTPEMSFLTADDMVFDGQKTADLQTTLPKMEKWSGKLKIWELPKKDRRYIIGADPAEGVGGDASVAEVIDAVTLEQVAEYASNVVKPKKFGELLAKLGRFYNTADIAPERNNHGHAVIDSLREHYPTAKIYKQQTYDETRRKKKRKLGWETNARTKPLIIDHFVDMFENGQVGIKSGTLKKEMLTFIEQDGKMGAKTGKHDDRVMAFAIALYVASLPKRSLVWKSL